MDALTGFLIAGLGAALLAAVMQYRQAAALRQELNGLRGRVEAAESRAAGAQATEALLREQSERTAQSEQQLRAELNRERELATQQISELRERNAAIEARAVAEAQAHAEKLAALEAAEQRLRDSFAQLSGEALSKNQGDFLRLAEEHLKGQRVAATQDLAGLVQPLRDSLARQEQQVKALEEARATAYGGLDAVLNDLRQTQQSLRQETAKLAEGLRNPVVRGRWGEIQLRRVVEYAGMLEHCDFVEQQSSTNDKDSRQRPDMIIHLPNKRMIIVDAKVPLASFLDALDAPEERRAQLLNGHARAVRGHIDEMKKRDYPKTYEGAHDFTVIFLPGEVFFQAALENGHDLLEYAFERNVLIASPNTLVAVLKSAAFGWRETTLADNARAVQNKAKDIYERMSTVGEYLGGLGDRLRQSVDQYNKLVGSMETRLMPALRDMKKLGVSDAEPATMGRVIESQPRELTSALLLEGGTGDQAVAAG